MPNKYTKPKKTPKKPKPKPRKPVKQPKKTKGVNKQKPLSEKTMRGEGDVVTHQIDANEPLKYNVEKDIKEDKKVKPTDVFE
jgi:hypothetical protein